MHKYGNSIYNNLLDEKQQTEHRGIDPSNQKQLRHLEATVEIPRTLSYFAIEEQGGSISYISNCFNQGIICWKAQNGLGLTYAT